jgi:hypothetical protein
VDRLMETRNGTEAGYDQLADLIRASEPVVVSPARQQHLLNGILRQQVRRTSAASRLLRPVFVVGVLSLAGAATAAATLGRRVWNDLHIAPIADVSAGAAPASPVRRTRPSRGAARARLAVADESPMVDPEPIVAPRPSRRVKSTARPRIAPARILSSEDPSRVVDAIQSLRTDHNPVRASRLLAEYLTRYPNGALAEEAIALSIEAAAANHSPTAVTFAERYLSQYPNGRFRHTAEQVLAHQPN